MRQSAVPLNPIIPHYSQDRSKERKGERASGRNVLGYCSFLCVLPRHGGKVKSSVSANAHLLADVTNPR